MSGRLSTYETPKGKRFSTILNVEGSATKEDELFIENLVSSFVNSQNALFHRWIKVRVGDQMQPSSQMVVLTPLRIILLPTTQSPKRMKQYRIIDAVSLFAEENQQFSAMDSPTMHTAPSLLNGNGASMSMNSGFPNGFGVAHSGTHGTMPKMVAVPTPQRSYGSPMAQTPPSTPVMTKSRSIGKPLSLLRRRKKRNNHSTSNQQTVNQSTALSVHRMGQRPPLQLLRKQPSDPTAAPIFARHQPQNAHHFTASSSSMTSLQSGSISPAPSMSMEAICDDNHYAKAIEGDDGLSPSGCSKSHSSPSSLYRSWLYHCNIRFHQLDAIELSYDDLAAHHIHTASPKTLPTVSLDFYFDSVAVARHFVDILRFYLFTLHRGVPTEYRPKIQIIPDSLRPQSNMDSNHLGMANAKYARGSEYDVARRPFVASQVFIDRYLAFCDKQSIPALDSVIGYVVHSHNTDTDIFDVATALSPQRLRGHRSSVSLQMNAANVSAALSAPVNGSLDLRHHPYLNGQSAPQKQRAPKFEQQQYVAVSHAMAFLKMYRTLCLDRLHTADSNMATLMKIFETNRHVESCQFRKCGAKKITMQSLSISLRSISLSAGISNLKELSIVDVHCSRSMLKELGPGLEHCKLTTLELPQCTLSEKSIVYLLALLLASGQHNSIRRLNLAANHCGEEGTKQCAHYLMRSTTLETLIICDSKMDGNILFGALGQQQQTQSVSNGSRDVLSRPHHGYQCLVERLKYLDFSGNPLGDQGAVALSHFVRCAKALQCLKVSRCAMTGPQLNSIFGAALANCSGLECIDSLRAESIDANEVADDDNNGPSGRRRDVDGPREDQHEEIRLHLMSGSETDNGPMVNIESVQNDDDDEKRDRNENEHYVNGGTRTRSMTVSSRRNAAIDAKACCNSFDSMYRPTRSDLIQCRHLLRLTLDLSGNNLGSRGSEIMWQLMSDRLRSDRLGNYTVVSLSIANNGFGTGDLLRIVSTLHCCICLESLNISENIKSNIFTQNMSLFSKSKLGSHRMKHTKSKSSKLTKAVSDSMYSVNGTQLSSTTSVSSISSAGSIGSTLSLRHHFSHEPVAAEVLGRALVTLCERATNLERLQLHHNELGAGLNPFLSQMAYLSNLKFVDLSGTKLGDDQLKMLTLSLKYNRTFIRALKVGGNLKGVTAGVMISYLRGLVDHTSLIDVNTCLPRECILKFLKMRKYAPTFTRLQSEASLNLRNNKLQYDIDRKMVQSLPTRERLEKQLRLQCGAQFGVPLESIRGTIQFAEYHSRIPMVLIALRNYLKSKGGFRTKEIFRFHADSDQFDRFKRDLNANHEGAKTDDNHSIANAIKAFYHDLPVKVLNALSVVTIESVRCIDDVAPVLTMIPEPFRSLFEWLLDLCVDIVANTKYNKMTHRSMAVVLCPSLYNACMDIASGHQAKILRAVMWFTDFAIQWRIQYRVDHPVQNVEEMLRDPDHQNTKTSKKKKMNGQNDTAKHPQSNGLDAKHDDDDDDDGDIMNAPSPSYTVLVQRWNEAMHDVTANDVDQQAWSDCATYGDEDGHDEEEEEEEERVSDSDEIMTTSKRKVMINAMTAAKIGFDHLQQHKQWQMCHSMDRITFILQYYAKWIQHQTQMQLQSDRYPSSYPDSLQPPSPSPSPSTASCYNHPIIDFITNLQSYGVVALTNDFNHILRYHSSNEEMEGIMHDLRRVVTQCGGVTKCLCMLRTHRNRDCDEDQSQRTMYFGYSDSSEVAAQQILDKMHCFLMHSMETTRLTTMERVKIDKCGEEEMIAPRDGTRSTMSQHSRDRTLTICLQHQMGHQQRRDERLQVWRDIMAPKMEHLMAIRGSHRVKGAKFTTNLKVVMERVDGNASVQKLRRLEEANCNDSDDADDDNGGGGGRGGPYDKRGEMHGATTTLGQPFTYCDSGNVSTPSVEGMHRLNDWFIWGKYRNFKEEMLQNSICRLSVISWNDHYAKALVLQKCTLSLRMASRSIITSKRTRPRTPTPNTRDSEHGPELDVLDDVKEEEQSVDCMPMEHLIAVLVYCNSDHLRMALSATFYPQSMGETVTNWKLRHSEYCHWSQILREAVHSGHSLDNSNGNDDGDGLDVLYHSTTNHVFLSPKPMRCFYPMSCSRRFGVGYSFCPQNGHLLKLKVSNDPKQKCFDCRWISDFTDFDEVLTFAADKRGKVLRISNVLDVTASRDYKMFWNALSLFDAVINGQRICISDHSDDKEGGDTFHEDDIHCLSLLMEWQLQRKDKDQNDHQRSHSISFSSHRQRSSTSSDRRGTKKWFLMIPPFIEALFDRFCRQNMQITLSLSDFVAAPLLYKVFCGNFGWIKLDLFCNLFCNMESIRILHVVLNHNIFEALCQFLTQITFRRSRSGTVGVERKKQRRSSILDLISSSTSLTPNMPELESGFPETQSVGKYENFKLKKYQKRKKAKKDGSQSQSAGLSLLHFCCVDEEYMSCSEVIRKFQPKFNELGWTLKAAESSLFITRQ